jgi:hypothetical protein
MGSDFVTYGKKIVIVILRIKWFSFSKLSLFAQDFGADSMRF